MGICNDYVAHPIRQFDKSDKDLIFEYVEKIRSMINDYEKLKIRN